MRAVLLSLLLTLAATSAAAATAPPAAAVRPATAADLPVEAFLKLDAFSMIKISPDGAHIAATVPLEGRMMLAILRRSDMKQTAGITLEDEAEVDDFVWINPRQVLYSVQQKNGSLAAPIANPYLYLANADGSKGRVVNKDWGMYLIDELRDDDDHILIGPGIYKIKLSNGQIAEKKYVASPLGDEWHYPDNAGESRLVTGRFANSPHRRLYLRVDGDWMPINDPADSGVLAYPMGFSADNRTAYLGVEELTGPDSLYALDLQTGQRKLVHRDARVDPNNVLRSPVDGGVVAVTYLDGKPKMHIVAPEDRFAKELAKIARAFPDQFVTPTSYTRDGNLGVYLVSSDVNSGEFYLVDHVRGKADYLAERQELMLPDLMSPMRPFRFKARDGMELEGFLTVPASQPAGRPGPLVVIPHGGPKGVYDTWGFDPEIQLLASRGYSVLQVNFRGSGNYGRGFIQAGNLQWGKGMIDDILDATKWAIAEGVATSGRICMYGASYGAYASMMALAREPNLFACGIGNVGVYDIRKMYAEDTFASRHSQIFFDELFGKRADLEAISPNRFADRIKDPVLLGAGEEDDTAPPEHTDKMHRALLNAGVPVEAVEYDGEAHGNYLLKNRVDWAKRVLAILERTIGRPTGATAADAPAAPPADAASAP